MRCSCASSHCTVVLCLIFMFEYVFDSVIVHSRQKILCLLLAIPVCVFLCLCTWSRKLTISATRHMHLSTTTTPTKNPTFILFERLLFARVRACINIHELYKLCCAPFHTGHDFFVARSYCIPFIYVCFVFLPLYIVSTFISSPAKNWPLAIKYR